MSREKAMRNTKTAGKKKGGYNTERYKATIIDEEQELKKFPQ